VLLFFQTAISQTPLVRIKNYVCRYTCTFWKSQFCCSVLFTWYNMPFISYQMKLI